MGEFEYGVFLSITNLTFLLNIFSDLKVNNYNVKNISQHSFLLKNISKIIHKIIVGFFIFNCKLRKIFLVVILKSNFLLFNQF